MKNKIILLLNCACLSLVLLASCESNQEITEATTLKKNDNSVNALNAATAQTASAGTLIFQSGFGGTSKIVAGSSAQFEDITGIDSSVPAPNDWVAHFDNHTNIGNFNINYEGGTASQRYAKIIAEPNNTSNKVFQFWLGEPNVSDANGPSKARIQTDLNGNTSLHEIYQSVRLYFHPDCAKLKDYPAAFSWFTLFEFWNNGNWFSTQDPYPFRISVNVKKPSATVGTDLYLNVHGQTYDYGTKKFTDVWSNTNTSFAVPIGQWMTIDYYLREGNGTAGRYYMSITPQGGTKTVIFDITNFSHHPNDPAPDGFRHLNPMKLYTSKELSQFMKNNSKAIQLYWDDFKFWKDRTPQ
jgi:hypothetical protein